MDLKLKFLIHRHPGFVKQRLKHMKFSKSLAFAAVALALSCAAQAQSASDNVYGEIGYTAATYSVGGYNVYPSAIRGVVGKTFGPNLAVEGMVAFGAESANTTILGNGVSVKLDNMVGLYIKPSFQPCREAELFARFGYAQVNATASVAGVSTKGTDSSFSYGVGGSHMVNNKVAVNLDYMLYTSVNGGDSSGVTVGVSYKF
jgi:Outer membrane protein beta-barrel domain